MRCKNCHSANFTHKRSFKKGNRLECNHCKLRFDIYNTPEDEVLAYRDAIRMGIPGENFLYNINKEKE